MRKRVFDEHPSQGGFTLIELLAVVTLMAILFTIGAAALRRYWLVQGLSAAQNELVTQLRDMQQESRSTAPKVFGARFDVGSSDWELISYDPEIDPLGQRCSRVDERQLPGGVVVDSVDFESELLAGRAPCLSSGHDDLVLFYARGNAIRGRITVSQPALDRSLSVCVGALTGRVSRC